MSPFTWIAVSLVLTFRAWGYPSQEGTALLQLQHDGNVVYTGDRTAVPLGQLPTDEVVYADEEEEEEEEAIVVSPDEVSPEVFLSYLSSSGGVRNPLDVSKIILDLNDSEDIRKRLMAEGIPRQ